MNTLDLLVCKTFTNKLPGTAILVCDPEMRCVHQSGELDFLGEFIPYQDIRTRVGSTQGQNIVDHLTRALKGEETSLQQAHQNRLYQQHFTPIHDEAQNIIAAAMVSYRISLDYMDSNNPYRALFNQTNDAVFVINPDGIFLDTNLYAERMLGYTRADLLNLNIEQIIPQNERPGCQQRFQYLIDGKTVPVYECIFIHADGSERIGQVNLTLVHRDLSADSLIQCVVRDITEAKAAEKALRESEARFRSVAETTTDLIYEWDFATNTVWYSQGLRNVFEHVSPETPDATYLAQWWLEHIHPKDRERIENELYQVLQSKESSLKREYLWQRVDGTYADMIEHVRIIRDDDDQPIRWLGTLTDVSEQKRIAEQEVALMLEKAHNEMFNNFVTSLSHDFRTPLSVIHNNTYLVSRIDNPQERTRLQGVIRDQARQIEKLVDSLLVMAQVNRIKAHTWAPVNLNELIGYIMVRLEDQKNPDIPLRLVLAEDLPSINGESRWLSRALSAIIENAIRFTPAGWIEIRSFTQEDQVLISVTDTGIGIDDDEIEHIFEPLYRADKHRPLGNQGLGLAIANRIIEQHGGKISVESTKSQGSTFTFMLPRPKIR